MVGFLRCGHIINYYGTQHFQRKCFICLIIIQQVSIGAWLALYLYGDVVPEKDEYWKLLFAVSSNYLVNNGSTHILSTLGI